VSDGVNEKVVIMKKTVKHF
jgi:hypothetical protein